LKIRKVFTAFLVLVVMGSLIISDGMILSVTASTSLLKKNLLQETSKTQRTKEKILFQTTSSDEALEVFQRDATVILLETWKNKYDVALKNQELPLLFKRPTDPTGGIDDNQHLLPQLYNTTHFVLHWTNGSDGGLSVDAVPLNDTNENGIPDYIENFGVIFENVWNAEITIRGFLTPPDDSSEPNDSNRRNPDGRYDVFIYNMQYYGYAYPEQWPESPSCSYIAVDNDYNGFPTPQLGAMQVTAAHEFFHAIQFVYDCTEEIWWMETTATYMEDEVYPEVNDNYQYLPRWFELCDTYGLESTEGSHEYGNFIFAKRLSEDWNDNIIREIWEEMNYTNGLEAIDNVLTNKNSSLISEFNKFITANFFLEDMYVDGTEYRQAITGKTAFNGVWLEYQYNASITSEVTEINSTNVNWDAWMDKWATDYITLNLDPEKPEYNIFFEGLDLGTNYLVKLVTKKAGNITENIFQLSGQKEGSLYLSYDTYENITLVIANVGNTTTSNPSWRVVITAYLIPPPPIYDVAIIGLNLSTSLAVPEQSIAIYVIAKNNGTIREENFNISIYWGEFLIETQPVNRLVPGATEILEINWTIPLGLLGNKQVWANATRVEGETNLQNNHYKDGILKIEEIVHDIVIENITLVKNLIGNGLPMNVTVLLSNQGTISDVVNGTISLNNTIIGTFLVSISPKTTQDIEVEIVIPSNLSELHLYLNYSLKIEIAPVSGETNIGDNTLTDGWLIITIPGDVNGDKKVDIFDIVTISAAYGAKNYEQNYNPYSDVDGNGIVDLFDVVIGASYYGEKFS